MMSSLEKVVYKILKASGVNFIQEKQFKDCYNGLYRFDFFLPDSRICIELNGAQHYSYVKNFHKSKSDFLKGQERDRRKISYCLANDISLYIIPYWEIESINSLEDIFQKKFQPVDKFHNDTTYREFRRKK